jgi:hypothetical protein
MTSPAEDAVAVEFTTLVRRLEIDVPADLLGGVLHGYASLNAMTALLRGTAAKPAVDESTGLPGA